MNFSDRVKEAHNNFRRYMADGMLKKEQNDTAKHVYLDNSTMSLELAQKLILDSLKPYLWVIVISYYSMFYQANAYLLHMGYRVSERSVHKVTSDAIIVLATDKLKKELIIEYEDTMEDALAISSNRAAEIVISLDMERIKRSEIQYGVSDSIKRTKAEISLQRAKEFRLEISKLMQ